MAEEHPDPSIRAAIKRLLVTAKAQGPNGRPLDHGGHEMAMHDWLVAGLTDLLDILPPAQPDTSALVEAVGFFASAVKCGEPWTDQCQEVFNRALTRQPP